MVTSCCDDVSSPELGPAQLAGSFLHEDPVIRRSFMSMLGLAPAAAIVAPSVSQSTQAGAAGGPWKSAESWKFVAGGVNVTPDVIDDSLVDSLRSSVEELRLAKRMGILDVEDDGMSLSEGMGSPNIDSLRATSPAIKAILQAKWKRERRMYAAERRLTRALMMRGLPWNMRRFLDW